MLKNSWVLFEGIGDGIETKLWEQGLRDWPDEAGFTRACEMAPKLQSQKVMRGPGAVALNTLDVGAISDALPQNELWRLWEQFGGDALYLDIETNGLGSWAHITLLGTYYRGKYRAFVYEKDLQ